MKLVIVTAVVILVQFFLGCTAKNKTGQSGIDTDFFDAAIRAQDNFYLHVNGGWMKTHEIPDDKTSIGAFYSLRDKAREDVKHIIESLADKGKLTKGSDEQKIAEFYRSFMDTSRINKAGITPLKQPFSDIDSLKNKDQLAAYFADAGKIGAGSPWNYYVSTDLKNSDQYALYLWQGGLSLPDQDYYFNKGERFVKLRKGLVEHIEKMFTLAGFSNAKQLSNTVFTLETKLAGFHWTNVQNRDTEKRYNKYPKNDLKKLGVNFNWSTYLHQLGADNIGSVIVSQPSFAKGFNKIFAETPLSDWKTYMQWHVLNSYASLLSDDIAEQQFAFYGTKMDGQKKQKDRWERGVMLVNGTLGELVGKVYIKKYFPPDHKKHMLHLIENIREAYHQGIDELTWMSDATKKKAQIKLKAFTAKIGYPDKWHDYSAVDISTDRIVTNTMNASTAAHDREIKKLGGPIQRWEWGMNPQTVNAYYSPGMNEIVFPAAILQPPFFNTDADDAVNYGGIGAVIGHEMGHGFDDQGAKFDGRGNLENWWSDEDLKQFQQRSESLVNQYDRYEVLDDLSVNGKLTLGENIGDLSGATIAYKAYKLSLSGKEAPVIDGFTGDQRFFIGFAQIWRSKDREKKLRNQVATDPHSPSEFRANGPLSNMTEFYKAFDVKKGDGMYIDKEERVKIW